MYASFSCMLYVRRDVLEDKVQEAQQAFRASRCHSEEGKKACDASSEDDIFRAYGVLLAVSRYTDKLVLMAKMLLRDKFLKKRAPRRMVCRSFAYV